MPQTSDLPHPPIRPFGPWLSYWLRAAWAYTLGHPVTWDLAAAAVVCLTARLGWFRWWVTAAPALYLLVRVLLLRREVRRLTH